MHKQVLISFIFVIGFFIYSCQGWSQDKQEEAFFENPTFLPQQSLIDKENKVKKIPVDIFYDRGVWFSGADNTLRVGGDLEVDARTFLRHSNEPSNFRIRRGRFILEGTIQNYFGFLLVPLFTTREPAILQYAYLETLKPEYARLRFGLFKEPFSLEGLRSDLILEFTERSLGIINFIHLEDIGLMAFGSTWHNKLEYGVGIFNGRGKRLENNSKKEYVGRVVYAPFLGSHHYLDQLYLGTSLSTSHQDEDLTHTFFETGAGTRFWEWIGTSNCCVDWDDTRNRWGMDFEWFYGSFTIRGEYLYVDWGQVRQCFKKAHFKSESGYMAMAYILTGEKKERNKWIVPFHNFPCGWGAWEIAARYEILDLDSESLRKGLAIGTSRVQGFTVALNIYFNSYMALKIDWEHFAFKEPVKWDHHCIHGESVIITRLQAIF